MRRSDGHISGLDAGNDRCYSIEINDNQRIISHEKIAG